MLVFGGEKWSCDNFDVTVHLFNDLWSYNPEEDHWRLLSTEGPRHRTQHAAAWTGSELLIWGGWGGVPKVKGVLTEPRWLVADGWRYKPAEGLWTSMGTVDQPRPRHSTIDAWTGQELVILGGALDSSKDSGRTGARYNPATDSWVPTTTNGAPRIGFLVGGVWTGRELLVFGDESSSTAFNSVFAYFPPGLYESDTLPDEWQRQYFGEDNPSALPEIDADGDGQNNLFESVAGTDPTDAGSRFDLKIWYDGPLVRLSFPHCSPAGITSSKLQTT
jgi:hypothetical protein